MFFSVVAASAIWFLGALLTAWLQRDDRDAPADPAAWHPPGVKHPVTILTPKGEALVDSGRKDHRGQPIMVACATCHEQRKPDPTIRDSQALDEFHRGLQYAHGKSSCLSCHNSADYNTLRTADGTALDFKDSIGLCAQCHGPQHRDYQNGSHGGMNGYWDLGRGPRQRNHCTSCHDPHHPAYPRVMPVFPPKPVIGEAHPGHAVKNKH